MLQVCMVVLYFQLQRLCYLYVCLFLPRFNLLTFFSSRTDLWPTSLSLSVSLSQLELMGTLAVFTPSTQTADKLSQHRIYTNTHTALMSSCVCVMSQLHSEHKQTHTHTHKSLTAPFSLLILGWFFFSNSCCSYNSSVISASSSSTNNTSLVWRVYRSSVFIHKLFSVQDKVIWKEAKLVYTGGDVLGWQADRKEGRMAVWDGGGREVEGWYLTVKEGRGKDGKDTDGRKEVERKDSQLCRGEREREERHKSSSPPRLI